MHVALIGPMGAGKTTVGTLVAERLGLPYLDNDDLLAGAQGLSAAEFEERHGTEVLHAAEAATLLDMLASGEPAVITAAASTIESPACRDALARRAFTIFIRVSPERSAAKVRDSDRPRAQESAEALAGLARRREPAYRQAADIVIDRQEVDDADTAANLVLEAFGRIGSGAGRRT